MVEEADVDLLRACAKEQRVHWHLHALKRMLERGISRAEVLDTVIQGEIIEAYPGDRPHPSWLILGVAAEPLHVVAAVDAVPRISHVITAYRPDLEHFEPDFRTRRKKS